MRRLVPHAALAALAVAAAGCGEDPDARFALKTPPAKQGAAPIAQADRQGAGERARRPTRRDAERSRPLLKAWSDALRRGDVERAARYFAVPAIVAQTATFRLQTRHDVREFNDGLPCGARLRGVGRGGRFIIGTFQLTQRPGGLCLTPGAVVQVAVVTVGPRCTGGRQSQRGHPPAPARPEDPETLPTLAAGVA
jgi:hypothetical protein